MRQTHVLDPSQLETYALQWRSLAREWTRMAWSRTNLESAAKLRRTAQRALLAAYEIDLFLENAQLPGTTDK